MKTTKTYFIAAGDTGMVKIGKSHSPEKRLATLQTGNAERLRFIAIVEGDFEAKFHELLREHRIGGEWFRDVADGEILKYLAKLRDETQEFADEQHLNEYVEVMKQERLTVAEPMKRTTRKFRKRVLDRYMHVDKEVATNMRLTQRRMVEELKHLKTANPGTAQSREIK